MDNTKYIDTNSWKICDTPVNFIPVDKGIAKTICTLNKKGYITKSSCEGHHDIRFVDMDDVDIAYLDEFKSDPRAIIKEIRDDSFDYWTEVYGTSIYILFNDTYKFASLPEGFKLEDGNCLRHNIEYYDDNLKRRTIPLINEEIKKHNKILEIWASKLPNIRKDD